MEPTLLADEMPFGEREVATAEIISSKIEDTAAPEVAHAIQQRAGTLTTAKVVTVFSTSITFVPTTITSTRLIASASALLCLPNGYAVCA